MNKKAIHRMIIVGFIIVIIEGILYLTFFNPWKKGTVREIHKQECKDSVRLSSLTQVKQYQFRPGIIECPIWEETIKGNPDSKKQSDRMKREIAQLMAEGWDVFGRGKLNLFESSGVYCSVYSIIDFEQKDKKIDDVGRYLARTPVPLEGVDYLTFFTNDATQRSDAYLASAKNIVVDTSKRYAVVFVYIRQLGTIDEYTSKLGQLVSGGQQSGEQFVGTIAAGTMSAAGVGGIILFLGGGWTIATAGAIVAGGFVAYTSVFGG